MSEQPTTNNLSLRLLGAAVVGAFFLGYAGSPVAAQENLTNVAVGADLDTSLPALVVLVAKETQASAGPAKPPSARDILLAVCQKRGYGEDCAKTLYGMVWKESRFISDAVGDRGKAQGYFQIHYKLHKISLACARDLKCSATWSLGYMERNGYPKQVTRAVQCHNGCGARNGYASAVKTVGARRWKEAAIAEKGTPVKTIVPAPASIKTVAAKAGKAAAPVKSKPAKHQRTTTDKQLAALIKREK